MRNLSDLRVQKTRQAIRQSFQEMVCSMKYKEITVRKIAEKSHINRKTFYLHYPTLDDLMLEFQNEVINFILSADIKCDNLADMQKMIGAFFDFVADLPKFHERLICDESYQFIGEKINLAFIKQLKTRVHGQLSKDQDKEEIICTYLGSNAFTLYKHWVNNGKTMPLDKLKTLTIQLMSNGLKDFLEKSNNQSNYVA